MSQVEITYGDKELNRASGVPVEKKWRFEDANEVKNKVNANAADAETRLAAGVTALGDHISVDTNPHGDNLNQLSIDFIPQAVAPAHKEGRVFYDSVRKTLNVYNGVADMTLNLGEEQVIRIWNDTGQTILNGSLVRTGNNAISGLPTVLLSLADTIDNAQVAGAATHDIEDGTAGYITILGSVGGLDTSSLIAGTLLYLSESVAGGYTQDEQEILNPVGVVLTSDVDGTVFIKPRGVINLTAIGQATGQGFTDDLTIAPKVLYAFTENGFTLNTVLNQSQNPDAGVGWSALLSPEPIGAAGFYRFFFNCSITGAGNVVHIFELFIDGAATGIEARIALTNAQTDEGNASITGITESKLTNASVLEMRVRTSGGASAVTYDSVLFGIERIGNA